MHPIKHLFDEINRGYWGIPTPAEGRTAQRHAKPSAWLGQPLFRKRRGRG